MAAPLLETLATKNTAPDGWRPAYDEAFIERCGWIFLGVYVSSALAMQLGGEASFYAFVFGGYFVARGIEHLWVRAQFWLSTSAFALASVTIVVATFLRGEPIAAGVMASAVIGSVAVGVGRRIHASRAMVLFSIPLGSWCLGDDELTVDVLTLVSLVIALLVLSLSRRDQRHALAERIAGRVRLDSGEVYAMHRRHVLRLGSRTDRETRDRFTVFTGPLESPVEGRVWIGRRNDARLPRRSELCRTLAGSTFVVTFEHPSALTEAIAAGALDDALAGLARLRDPLVDIEGNTLRIETTSHGDEAAETLVRVGRAFGEKASEAVTHGAYR